MKKRISSNYEVVERIGTSATNSLLQCNWYQKLASEVLSLYQPVDYREFNNSYLSNVKLLGDLRNNTLVSLVILSYYMEPVFSYYIRLEVEDLFLQRPGSEDLALLCKSRDTAMKFLFTSTRYNIRKILGTFNTDNFNQVLKKIKVIPQFSEIYNNSRKGIKRPVRHKGYRDKGTLPVPDAIARREELLRERTFLLEQLRIEEYSDSIDHYLAVNLSWLNGIESFLLSNNYYYNSKKGIIYYENERITIQQDSGHKDSNSGDGNEERKSRA